MPIVSFGSQVNSEGTITAKITEVALGGILQGWALNRQAPARAIKFKVLIDGQAVRTVTTIFLLLLRQWLLTWKQKG
ncbi:MAG: hypothetical protein HC930_18550 [Hydrococcus sp. SU_1_0]|nr:hypothetical protein [Hydrococcus sp. SU_1_0]